MPKIHLGVSVLDAARDRVAYAFDNFEKLYVSFSGGKDSSVLFHLVADEARKRNRRFGGLFIDWECQFTLTISHVREMFLLHADVCDPYWYQVPLTTWNGCSQIEPEWTCWDSSKKDIWVRDKEKNAITDKAAVPFWKNGISFEEFTEEFAAWYGDGKPCGAFIGIRAGESLNRFRTIARDKPTHNGKQFTTLVAGDTWNVYPIYDWKTSDIWIYNAKFAAKYNRLYDRMHQAGMKLSQMRIDEPFGDTQRQSLWLFQIIEPEMWAKMLARVAGASVGGLYGEESGNILGNRMIKLPTGHTWKSFCELLLDTMPPKTAEHYKNKIATFVKWHLDRAYPNGIPDSADYKLEAYGKAPSWRKICKVLLRNDYWCRGLHFGITKSSAYDKYLALMKRRREEWGIFGGKS
jgi:predicted phosphoadenosine phosphosulfate sulfurtransferase